MDETQEYLVLAQIGGAGDPEIWRPGSKIWLTAEAATAHLASANVREIETTKPLVVEPSAIIYTAEVPEPPNRRRRVKVADEETTMEVDTWPH